MIFIVVKFAVKPEHSDGWMDRVADFTAATRAEPGNLWFDWSRSMDDPNEYVLVEAFADQEAGVAHVGSDHFKAAMAVFPPALAATPKIINVQVEGTDWATMSELRPTD